MHKEIRVKEKWGGPIPRECTLCGRQIKKVMIHAATLVRYKRPYWETMCVICGIAHGISPKKARIYERVENTNVFVREI